MNWIDTSNEYEVYTVKIIQLFFNGMRTNHTDVQVSIHIFYCELICSMWTWADAAFLKIMPPILSIN